MKRRVVSVVLLLILALSAGGCRMFSETIDLMKEMPGYRLDEEITEYKSRRIVWDVDVPGELDAISITETKGKVAVLLQGSPEKGSDTGTYYVTLLKKDGTCSDLIPAEDLGIARYYAHVTSDSNGKVYLFAYSKEVAKIFPIDFEKKTISDPVTLQKNGELLLYFTPYICIDTNGTVYAKVTSQSGEQLLTCYTREGVFKETIGYVEKAGCIFREPGMVVTEIERRGRQFTLYSSDFSTDMTKDYSDFLKDDVLFWDGDTLIGYDALRIHIIDPIQGEVSRLYDLSSIFEMKDDDVFPIDFNVDEIVNGSTVRDIVVLDDGTLLFLNKTTENGSVYLISPGE